MRLMLRPVSAAFGAARHIARYLSYHAGDFHSK